MYSPNQPRPFEHGRKQPVQEQNKRRRGRLIGGAVLAGLVAFGAYVRGCFPGLVPAPEESRLELETLGIEPVNPDCRALTVFDASGSTARTKYQVGGLELDFTGYGAVMERGRIIMQTCAESTGVTGTVTEAPDGSERLDININVESMRFNSYFNEEDTEISRANPPFSQIIGGVFDIGSGAVRAACEVIAGATDFDNAKCDALNILANWNEDNQESLERALRVAVLENAQVNCGPLEWYDQRLAISDAYKQQAEAQGIDPANVTVNFVDGEGRESTEVPDFTQGLIDQLTAEGTLRAEAPGDPELEFESVTCTPLAGGYTPIYPSPEILP